MATATVPTTAEIVKYEAAAKRAYAEAQVNAYTVRLNSEARHRQAYAEAVDAAKCEGATVAQAVNAAHAATNAFGMAFKAAHEGGENHPRATHTASAAVIAVLDTPNEPITHSTINQPIYLNPRTRERMERLDHHLCGDVLFISSATEVGKMYKVTCHGCMCKAFTFNLKCYHMDIYRYLMATQPQPSTAGPRTPDEIDEQGDRHEMVARPVYRAIRRGVDPEIAIEAQMDAVRALGPRTYTQADYDDIC